MEPDTSSDQRPVIQASEILDKIERDEDVEYDGVIIEGDLDISGLELPTEHLHRTEFEKMLELSDKLKAVSSQITITGSEIRGNANFSNTLFLKPITFTKTKFVGDVDFGETEYSVYTSFMGAEFTREASFIRAKFNGNANFMGGFLLTSDLRSQKGPRQYF